MPKVSIIFPTFNGWQDTKECLESIKRLIYPKNKLEVVVVDNASTDVTVEAVNKFATRYHLRGEVEEPRHFEEDTSEVKKEVQLKIIELKKNFGFAKAVNLGIRKAKHDYLLITNNDVIFQPNYLTLLVNFLEKNPDVGIVGGKVFYKKPKDKVAFPGARFNFWSGMLKPSKNPDKTSETDWVPGCNLLVRREALEKIGLFDEKFFFYFEDLDLCLRAKKAGYKVIYCPKAILWHGEGSSINRQKWQKKSQFYYDGKTRILFKYASKTQLVTSLLFQFTFGLIFQLLILKHQNYTPAMKALINHLKNTSDAGVETSTTPPR